MRLSGILALASLLILAAPPAHARPVEDYVTATFKKAQTDNRTVVLHFYADWCPSCKGQKKVLDPLFATDESYLRRVYFLRIPFDDALELRKELAVNRQSTLLIFRGNKEVARAAGQTDPKELASFLKSHIPVE